MADSEIYYLIYGNRFEGDVKRFVFFSTENCGKLIKDNTDKFTVSLVDFINGIDSETYSLNLSTEYDLAPSSGTDRLVVVNCNYTVDLKSYKNSFLTVSPSSLLVAYPIDNNIDSNTILITKGKSSSGKDYLYYELELSYRDFLHLF